MFDKSSNNAFKCTHYFLRQKQISQIRLITLVSIIISLALPSQVYSQGTSSSGHVIEEITVTARKREETLMDVPVSISAFSGEFLESEGIDDIEKLIGIAPGITKSRGAQIITTNNTSFLVIRGVGSTSSLEPSTGTFIDGVYQTSVGFDTDFLDLERIEILRGPQGTIFGRNAQGGALNIVTRKPSNDFEAKIRIEASEYDTYKTQGSIGGPIVEDKLYYRFSALGKTTNGYLENKTLSGDSVFTPSLETRLSDKKPLENDEVGGRLSIRAVPTDKLEINATIDGLKSTGSANGVGVPIECDCYDVFDSVPGDLDNWYFGGSIIIDYDLDWSTLTSITGYRENHTDVLVDLAGEPLTGSWNGWIVDQNIISEELRLTSNPDNDNLDWLIGLYGFKEEHTGRQTSFLGDFTIAEPANVILNDFFENDVATIEREGFAIFGQGTYSWNQLNITLGLRYSWEEAENTALFFFTSPGLGNGPADPFIETFTIGPEPDRGTFSTITPMATLAWNWTPNIMTYATYAEGYKAGGYPKSPTPVNALPGGNEPVENEDSVNYELGLKASLYDGRLNIDTAIFYIDIKKQQLNTTRILNVGGQDLPANTIANAGESHSTGIEFQLNALPTERLSISGAFAYTSAKYDEYVAPGGTDFDGVKFSFVPEWMGSAFAQYSYPLSGFLNGKELITTMRYSYTGDYTVGSGGGGGFDPILPIDSHDTLDVSMSLESENWTVTAFANNVTDNYYIIDRRNSFLLDPAQFARATPGEPRIVGVRFSYDY